MVLAFRKISEFHRGILYRLLADAYSSGDRCAACWASDWREFDDFFFDNLDIADKYGFITTLNGEPTGHISWGPRNMPAYVRIGHNCIATPYKGNGYDKRQLQEVVDRIRRYDGVEKIIVETSSGLIAPRNYESVGFRLCARRENTTETAFAGDARPGKGRTPLV